MPEGPECTIIANSLNKLAQGRKLTNIEILSGRYQKTPITNLDLILNANIVEISNKGKFIYWKFDNSYNLFSTLGMSGGYSTAKTTHERIRFTLDNSLEIVYTDVRNFGTMKIANFAELEKKKREIGPDMLNNPCSINEFEKIIEKNKNWKLGPFLLEQKKLSGIGNIYKSEICYLAAINPSRTLSTIVGIELENLYCSIIHILQVALSLGGSSQKDYKDIDGTLGKFLSDISQVYRRTTDRLGNPVVSCELGDGRTTWWCPNVQK